MASRLSGLDALRGIAAVSVLAFHLTGGRGNAFLAVDFFFMLSGYVMARSFEDRMSSGLGFVPFLQLRFARLWPTMFIAGLVAAPIFFQRYGFETWPFVVANLLMIPAPEVNRVYPLNGPAWSILFELLANGLHALVLHRLSVRRLALVAAVALLCLGKFAWEAGSMDIGSTPGTFAAGFPRVVFSYTVGIMLYRIWRDRPSIRVPAWMTMLTMPALFAASSVSGVHFWFSDLLLVVLACPLLIAGGLQFDGLPKVSTYLGAISFPLYAVHVPISWWAEFTGLDPLGAAGISIAAACVMASAQAAALPAWLKRQAMRAGMMTVSASVASRTHGPRTTG